MGYSIIRYRFFLLITMCLFAAVGCETVPEQPSVSSYQEDIALNDICGRYGLRCNLDGSSQVIAIEGQGAQAKAMVGSDIVILDGKKIILGGLVRLNRGTVLVPPDFQFKVITPIVKKPSSVQKSFTVMIDAGHGGHDPGGIGYLGTKEKGIVLDIAKRIRTILEERGINTVMTRDSDEFISLEKRAELANQKHINLFVSIHANISKSSKVKGIEVYNLKELDAAERKEAMDPAKYQAMFRSYKMKQGDARLKKTVIAMMSDYKNSESDRLSGCLAREVSATAQIGNRGDKQAGFYVLKYTLVPSVLIEVGFLSNKTEEKNLQSAEYRQKIADGIADSLVRYAKDYTR